jgi:hypothetical protein
MWNKYLGVLRQIFFTLFSLLPLVPIRALLISTSTPFLHTRLSEVEDQYSLLSSGLQRRVVKRDPRVLEESNIKPSKKPPKASRIACLLLLLPSLAWLTLQSWRSRWYISRKRRALKTTRCYCPEDRIIKFFYLFLFVPCPPSVRIRTTCFPLSDYSLTLKMDKTGSS